MIVNKRKKTSKNKEGGLIYDMFVHHRSEIVHVVLQPRRRSVPHIFFKYLLHPSTGTRIGLLQLPRHTSHSHSYSGTLSFLRVAVQNMTALAERVHDV